VCSSNCQARRRLSSPALLAVLILTFGLIQIACSLDSNFVSPRPGCRSRDLVSSSKSRHLELLPGKTARFASDGFDPIAQLTDLQRKLSIQAVGSGSASWILNMGGNMILVNPNLEGSDIAPESVHEMFDCVLLTSEDDEFFHMPTISKMDIGQTKFVAGAKASERLNELMARKVITIQPGPGGIYQLDKQNSTGRVAIGTCPGAGGERPFGDLEQAFVFVNLDSSLALGYDARGQFLGQGASTGRQGIPDFAYEIDYLVSPDLRESAAVASGLAKKSGELRSVVHLPGSGRQFAEGGSNPLAMLDKALDSILGGIDDSPEAFREYVKQNKEISKIQLQTLERGGDPLVLNER